MLPEVADQLPDDTVGVFEVHRSVGVTQSPGESLFLQKYTVTVPASALVVELEPGSKQKN